MPKTGNPVLTETLKDLGSIYPNYKAGLNTRLSYKGLSLAMTFTAQQGGRAYSVTSAVLSTLGKLENSLPGRYDGLIADGVNLHADGTYSKNRTVTQNVVEYYNLYAQYRNNIEQHVYSTSFLKLKELRLDYSFPEQICRRLRVVPVHSAGLLRHEPLLLDEVAAVRSGSGVVGRRVALEGCRDRRLSDDADLRIQS